MAVKVFFDSSFLVGIGDKIRRSREKVDVGVRELARKANVDPAYLSRVERGETKPRDLAKVGAIVRYLPHSEAAKTFEHSGAPKRIIIDGIDDVLSCALALPPSAFEDEAWLGLITDKMHTLVAILQSKNIAHRDIGPNAWIVPARRRNLRRGTGLRK